MREARAVVMWPRLGPYHVARLQAAERLFRERGGRVIALETARTESIYAWDVVEKSEGFERITLFPEAEYTRLARAAIRDAVGRKLAELQPDAVATTGWGPIDSHAALAWCRRNGRAAIVMSDSTYGDRPRVWYREMLKARIVRLFDAALVGGKSSRDYVVQLSMAPERTLDGVDVVDNQFFAGEAARWRDPNQRLGPAPDACGGGYWLTVARLIEEKNLPLALEAYARYRAQVGPEAWNWVICGDGPMMGVVQEKRKVLGLESAVGLPGFVQLDGLPPYYAFAKALWLPSQSETWGLVVNEAMACGLPVLVSRAAGCAADLVAEGENGWTFDPTSADEMAEGLVRMHRLPQTRREAMGRRGRQIIADWGLDRFAEHLWKAVQAGLAHAARRQPGLSLVGRALLRC